MLFLNGSKIVCQFEDPSANEWFGRFGTIGPSGDRLREIPHISISPDWHFSCPVWTNGGTAIDDSHYVVEGEFSSVPRSQGGEIGRPDLEKHSQRSVALSVNSVTDRTGVAELGRRGSRSIALCSERDANAASSRNGDRYREDA